MTQKNRKRTEFLCFEVLDEGFSCSLGVLYGGLRISKLQFLIKKIKIKFPAVNLSIFGHQTLDPDPGSGIWIRNPESGSGIRISNKIKYWIRIRIRIKSMRIRNPGSRIRIRQALYGTITN
jgi:hypothetical protein